MEVLAPTSVVPFEPDEDHAALWAAATLEAGLCTIVGIVGSFSRRLGAQLAILPDGSVRGSLADGCLEEQLASDCRSLAAPAIRRYGSGSSAIDFRLPCGGGLDILVDPAPGRTLCAAAIEALQARRPASLPLPIAQGGSLRERTYIPRLRIVAIGEGPELDALAAVARAARIEVEAIDKRELTLGRPSVRAQGDAWTAVVLLFHDHEWETALLEAALEGEAFYIGAQGGGPARTARIDALRTRGLDEASLARIRSPIGMLARSRTPEMLALSAVTEIVHEYERLRPSA